MTTTLSPPAVLSLDSARVEDVMHSGVVTCLFETPLAEVARMMAAHHVHCVVGFGDAAEGDTRLWGIVSDRDVVAAAATDYAHRTAGTSATTQTATIEPEATVRRAAEVMTERNVSHLLVVEAGSDRPVGVISTLDIAAVMAGVATTSVARSGTRADALMSAPVVTVAPETSLKEVAALLVDRGISAVPVVQDGSVVGVVSESDIVAAEGVRDPHRKHVLAGFLHRNHGDVMTGLVARTAGEAMTAPAVTIEFWQQASAAATLMTERRVNHLPVLSAGTLVGMLSRADLVRAFARPDAEIEREIRDDVLVEGFWLGNQPGVAAAAVHRGEVTLEGAVETEADAEALPRRIRRVPGVVSVNSSLTVREPH
jgi:CBS domain-containing protein